MTSHMSHVLARTIRRFAIATQGVAAIEMAFIFPVMILLYFGLVDVTVLMSANRRVTIAANTLGDLVTQSTETIKKADITGFYKAVAPIMDPFPTTDVKIELFDYKLSNNAAVLSWKTSQNGTCSAAPSTTGLANLMTDGNDLVVARVCLDYKPITGKVIGSSPYRLQDELVLRPRQSPTLTCTDC